MRISHRIPSLLFLTAVHAGCVEPPPDLDHADGELAGTLAPEAHPAVGRAGGCSATLIADNLVLTAAHCLCGAAPGDPCGTSSFELTRVRRRDDPATPADESQQWTSALFTGNQAIGYPDFRLPDGVGNAHDLAILRLATPASSQPITVTPLGLATTIPAIGSLATLIGYGGFDSAGICNASDGAKRMGTTALDANIDLGLYGRHVQFDDPAVHLCPGDSGGPALDGSNRIFGVARWFQQPGISEHQAIQPALEWIGLQRLSPGNRVTMWDLALAAGYGAAGLYDDTDPDLTGLVGWNDSNDLHLVGDFRNVGRDEVLQINNSGTGWRVRIADYSDGQAPTEVRYEAAYESGTSNRLVGWTDSNDVQLVGDFMGRGYDQLLLLNRSGSGGRVRILDFSTPPLAQIAYDEIYGQSTMLAGWMDTNDRFAVGDFLSIGTDQLLMINNAASGGRVQLLDFSDGAMPAYRWRLYNYGDAALDPVFAGWHDTSDLVVAGDYMGNGRAQLLLANRGSGTGRVQVLDFGPTTPVRRYLELAGQSSVFDGYLDLGDAAFAGDFRGTGRDQLAIVDHGSGGGVLVADFSDGLVPATPVYHQRVNETVPYIGRLDTDDLKLAGNLRANGRAVLLTFERW